jgi:pilus assembly protein Flp/PilA
MEFPRCPEAASEGTIHRLPDLTLRVTEDKCPSELTGGGDNYMLKHFINMKLAIARLMDEEEGQGLTEYALILALIAIVAIVALQFLGGKVNDALSTVGSSLNT